VDGITGLVVGERSLTIRWTSGRESHYPWLWLRDHAHEPETLHPVTQQRQLFTAGLPPDLRGRAAAVVGDEVEIEWGAGRRSRLPVTFLHRFRNPEPVVVALDREVIRWDRVMIESDWPTVEHGDVMTDEAGVTKWLQLVARYGFCIVTGVPTELEATGALVRRVGYVRETIFGGLWDFQADLAKADTAYTKLELLPHTDGTYSHDAPGLQLLHCLAFEGTGGESTMVDGLRIAAELEDSAPEAYRTLSTVLVPGQYLGDGAHLVAARPVFRHDSSGALVQVSFNNYDRAPFLLPPAEMGGFYDALRSFESLANDRRLQWRRVLQPGEAILFDNWRVLHGRASYTGLRHMAGAYVNREDFESRLRVLA
jgi:trimethyllysine dioxygenase